MMVNGSVTANQGKSASASASAAFKSCFRRGKFEEAAKLALENPDVRNDLKAVVSTFEKSGWVYIEPMEGLGVKIREAEQLKPLFDARKIIEEKEAAEKEQAKA